MHDIPEPDWKVFRKLREVALERFCERVLAEIGGIAKSKGPSAHQRYLNLYKRLMQRDKELARAFNDFRRSTAIIQLIAIYSADLITDEELALFSEPTRAIVQMILKSRASE